MTIHHLTDHHGNVRDVEVMHDSDRDDYVGSIRGGIYRRMADGSECQAIIASGTAATPENAAASAIHDLQGRGELGRGTVS
jgi:hypothetical protein